MAQFNFEDILKKLSIDIPSHNFEGMLSDESLHPLFSWACKVFDEDNVLLGDEDASYQSLILKENPCVNIQLPGVMPESVSTDTCDISSEIQKSLDRRLQKAESHVCRMRYMEKKLNEKERVVLSDYNEIRGHLTTEVAHTKTQELINSLEATLKTCYTQKPTLPDLQLCKDSEKEAGSLLTSRYKSWILEFEGARQKELCTLNPVIDDLERKLTDAMLERRLSQRAISLRVKERYRPDVESKVTVNAVDRRNGNFDIKNHIGNSDLMKLQRESASYSYLQPIVQASHHLHIANLSHLFKTSASKNQRLNTFKRASTARLEFLGKVSSEVSNLEAIFGIKFPEINSELTAQDEPDLTCNNRSPLVNKQPSELAKRFLEPSQRDLIYLQVRDWFRVVVMTPSNGANAKWNKTCHLAWRESVWSPREWPALPYLINQSNLDGQIRKWLTELRCGPTLQLEILPTKFLVELGKLRQARLYCRSELNKVARLYAKFCESLKESKEWNHKLLWAQFLVKPHAIKSLIGANDESIPVASSTLLSNTMLNFSVLSDFRPE